MSRHNRKHVTGLTNRDMRVVLSATRVDTLPTNLQKQVSPQAAPVAGSPVPGAQKPSRVLSSQKPVLETVDDFTKSLTGKTFLVMNNHPELSPLVSEVPVGIGAVGPRHVDILPSYSPSKTAPTRLTHAGRDVLRTTTTERDSLAAHVTAEEVRTCTGVAIVAL